MNEKLKKTLWGTVAGFIAFSLLLVSIMASVYSVIVRVNTTERIYGSSALRIIQIAEAELGAINGDKYRSWWNGGYADGAAWCATFVSWCADQCGMLETIIPRFQGCSVGMNWFKAKDQWQEGPDYIPQMGDIIFFDWDPYEEGIDHVGFVWKCENGIVTTIEGNSGDRCVSNRYSLSYSCIVGYGTPAYPDMAYGDGMEMSEDDIYYLAQLVYAEAGSTWLTDHHQQMVASVVINRINSSLYPNTLREVIAQPRQYAPYLNGTLESMTPDERTIRNVRYVVENGPVCPSNVLTQSGYSYAWDGIYEVIYDPLGILMPTYFCIINE